VKTYFLILLTFVLASTIPTKAAPATAGELAAECRGNVADDSVPTDMVQAISMGRCQGYVQAWMEMTLVPSMNHGQAVTMIWKDGVKVGQMIRVYRLFIKNHPEKENELAVAKLLEAGSQAELVEANAGSLETRAE
jgi:hypothetical protein